MNQEKYCPKCEEYRDVRIQNRTETYTVRGKKIAVSVEVEVCAVCGETLLQGGGDEKVLDQVNAAYREQADLLSPTQIKRIRERYALSQKSFAALLGMSEATINRYEQGKLQEPSHDALLRACEDRQFIRERLALKGDLLSEWQRQRVEAALGEVSTDVGASSSRMAGDLNLRMLSPDEVTSRTGFRRFDFARYAAAVVFFCRRLGGVWHTKLNKLLFYADFLNYKLSTVSLTGTAYRRVPYGPVPADYDVLRSEMEERGIVCVEERDCGKGRTGYEIVLGPEADRVNLGIFTKGELAVLDHVAEQFRKVTGTAISRRSHRESAWQETEDRQLISYEKAMDLSLALPPNV